MVRVQFYSSFRFDNIPRSGPPWLARPSRPSLHGQKPTPTPKFLGTAKANFVCRITQLVFDSFKIPDRKKYQVFG